MCYNIARLNGYDLKQRNGRMISGHDVNVWENEIYLQLPFNSNEVTAAARLCLVRADLDNDVAFVSMQGIIPSDC